MELGSFFGKMETNRTGSALRMFLLVYILILAYPFYIYPVASGVDPCWIFALNHLANSDLFFGKDVIFTYGPLGFLIVPQPIGSNVSIALICHLSTWFLFAAVLFFGVIKRLFSVYRLLLFAIVMIPVGPFDFDYFICRLILLLLCFSLYLRNWLPWFFLAVLLTSALFFMKFSSGLFALPAVLALSSFQVLRDRNRGLLQLGFSLTLIPLLFAGAYLLYNPSFSDMLAYLRGSFEISSEYSVGMSIPGTWYEIYLALIFVIAYLFVSIQLYRSEQPSFWLSLAFFPSLFLAFKLGFVRQDGHVISFFIAALFIIGLLLLFSDLGRARMKQINYIFPVLVVICFFVYQQYRGHLLLDRIFPIESIKRITKIFDQVTPDKAFHLEKGKLPEDILTEIGRSRVGIFPWEISLVASNNLTYAPLPVLQSYSAYTSYLDNLDADFLSGTKAPPYLLMGFSGIDSRHCLIDVPSTWLSIYKWYEPCGLAQPVLLLRRKQVPRFERLEPAGTAEYRKSERVRLIECAEPLLVKISVSLTLTGKFVKTLYRISPVEMELTDDAGRTSVFRVMPDTLKNGIFLNYLPLDLLETDLLLNGTDPRRFCYFRLLGKGLAMYQDKMSVQFVKIPGVTINPPSADAYYNRGVTYCKPGNYWQAIAYFLRAIEINPKYAEAYKGRGVAYGNLHSYGQAISDFDMAIEINPKYAEAYKGRGVAYGKLGNYTKAIADFDRAIEMDPDYAIAYYDRGVIHNILRNYGQAITDFDRAIEINPDYAMAYYNRGVAYGILGNHSQEVEDLQKAARLDSEAAKK